MNRPAASVVPVLYALLLVVLPVLPAQAMRAQAPVELETRAEGQRIEVRAWGADTMRPLLTAIWRVNTDGSDAVCELHRAAGLPDAGPLHLDHLLLAAMCQYLDAHLRFQRNGVVSDRPTPQLALALDHIIAAAIDELTWEGPGVSLSPSTREQLMRLSTLDWSRAHFGVEGAGGDRYVAIYRFVRSQRDEMERQLRADLLPFAATDLLATGAGPGRTLRINSVCGTVFDEQNFLCALDLRLSDGLRAESDTASAPLIMWPNTARAATAVAPRMRKRDRWSKEDLDLIEQRLERMDRQQELLAISDRLDDIQGQVDDLRVELREQREERSAVNPLAELARLSGRPLTIRFERLSTSLSPAYAQLLQEVVDQLVRDPRERVLITGHADRSGDPVLNMRLSEERALVVRAWLLEHGVAPERLLLRYLGDVHSSGPEPDERRVEVEWLP